MRALPSILRAPRPDGFPDRPATARAAVACRAGRCGANGLRFAGVCGRWAALIFGCALGDGVYRAAANPLKFDPPEAAFGAVAQNRTLTREVTLTNTMAREVHILAITSDCSCTAGEPRERQLAPGASTVLPVHLQTKTFLGPLVRRLTVHTTEGDGELRVRAIIRPFEHWDVSPNPVVLPASRRDQPAAAELRAEYRGAGVRVVTAATADQPWLQAAVEPPEPGGGAGRVVRLRKLPGAPAGPHTVALTLATDDPREPQLALKVFVPVTAAVRVTPNPIILPTTRVGTAVEREFVISGWEEPLPPAVKFAGGTVAARGRRPDGDHVFAVSIAPPSPGMHTYSLRVLAGGHDIQVEVPVMVKAEPK